MYNPYRTRKTQDLWVCIILIGLGKPKICVNLFGIGELIKLLFKKKVEKEKPNPRKRHKVSFWNLSLLLQNKEFLLRFLYAFRFCNQTKSLAPTLKILLVFLCETVANQLQQSKGCCGVSHVLGFVQRSKPSTGIRTSDWLVTYWESCIKRRDCNYRISSIGYWGKSSTVGWYKILKFLYL